MKINGKKPGVFEDIVAFPRKEGSVVFYLTPVADIDDFAKQWPTPKPPMKHAPGKPPVPNLEDRAYKTELNQWAAQQMHWIRVQTLRNTPGLEWEKVIPTDSTTFVLFHAELKEAGLSDMEIGYLINKIDIVNGLNNAKLEEAREAFLTDQAVQQPASDSLTDGQNST